MEQTERQLVSLLSEITPLYDVPMREAKARQDALAKPPGSLGLLEDLSVQLAGITGQVKNEVSHTRIYVLAADNGVVCEGVSSAPQSVTRAQAINLTRGLTGASCLAKHFGDELVVADMGNALPYACPEILNRSLGKGTANIAAHERKLVRELARALAATERLEVFSHPSQTGVLSVRVKGVPAEQAAAQLADAGIAVRAGLHCAPLAHRTAGTEETGTVRLSFSFYSTPGQAEQAAEAFKLVKKL